MVKNPCKIEAIYPLYQSIITQLNGNVKQLSLCTDR